MSDDWIVGWACLGCYHSLDVGRALPLTSHRPKTCDLCGVESIAVMLTRDMQELYDARQKEQETKTD